MILDMALLGIVGLIVYGSHHSIKQIAAREQAKILEVRKLNKLD